MKKIPVYDKGIFLFETNKIISSLKKEGVHLEYDDLSDGLPLSIDNCYTLYNEGSVKGSIKELSIYKTNLSNKVFDILSEITELTDLTLTRNKIQEIPSSFTKLKCLQNLDLSDNEITNISISFVKKMNGCGINLENNYIVLSDNEIEILGEDYSVYVDTIIPNKAKVLTEGQTDVIYLKTAFQVFKKINLLEKIDIEWVGREEKNGRIYHTGDTALNHTKNTFFANPSLLKHPLILLYDCDTNKKDDDSNFLYTRKIQKNVRNEIFTAGIENLLPEELAKKIREESELKERFYKCKKKRTAYGELHLIETFQKVDFCNWVCKERNLHTDFVNFKETIEIIEKIVLST